MVINSDAKTSAVVVDSPTYEFKKVDTSNNRVPKPSGPNKIFNQEGVTYGDWRDDLVRDGYVVVKGAVPKERIEKYGNDMMSYLENL
jgi:hypothetical protein